MTLYIRVESSPVVKDYQSAVEESHESALNIPTSTNKLSSLIWGSQPPAPHQEEDWIAIRLALERDPCRMTSLLASVASECSLPRDYPVPRGSDIWVQRVEVRLKGHSDCQWLDARQKQQAVEMLAHLIECWYNCLWIGRSEVSIIPLRMSVTTWLKDACDYLGIRLACALGSSLQRYFPLTDAISGDQSEMPPRGCSNDETGCASALEQRRCFTETDRSSPPAAAVSTTSFGDYTQNFGTADTADYLRAERAVCWLPSGDADVHDHAST